MHHLMINHGDMDAVFDAFEDVQSRLEAVLTGDPEDFLSQSYFWQQERNAAHARLKDALDNVMSDESVSPRERAYWAARLAKIMGKEEVLFQLLRKLNYGKRKPSLMLRSISLKN